MKRTSLLSLLTLVLCLILALAKCTPQSPLATIAPESQATQEVPTAFPEVKPPPTSEPLKLTDGLGRMVTLPDPAKRIVSMAPSNTEILFAIDAGGQVIGRDEFSDFPAEAKNLPSIGGGFGDYNNEAIVQLQPDLVLAAEINTPEQVKALEDLGLTVFLLANPTTLAELYDNLLLVGQMTGQEAKAAELVETLQQREAAVVDKLSAVSGRPRVFYELDNTDPSAPWTAGSETFIDTLISMAGGDNVAGNLDGQYVQLSLEALLVEDPHVMLLGDAAYGVTPESVGQRPGWEAISAVRDGRVYPFDDNLVSRPGPRLIDGLEALAKLLHPELFEQ